MAATEIGLQQFLIVCEMLPLAGMKTEQLGMM